MVPPSDPEIVTFHNKYSRLLRAYQAAKKTYAFDSSDENWNRPQYVSYDI